MARETKVGLLAGLAFIICFAVILANRGANTPTGLASSILPKGSLDLPRLVQKNQGAVDQVANSRRPAGPVQPPAQPAPQPVAYDHSPVQQPQLTDTSIPTSGAQLPPPSNTRPALPAPENTLAQITQSIRPYDLPQPEDASLARALTSKPGNDYPLDAGSSVPANLGTVADPIPTIPPAQHRTLQDGNSSPAPVSETPQGTRYTVKPSDTLSSIAAAHYGTKSIKAVEMIFNANRDVLTDVNHVKSGMVLFVPDKPSAASEKQAAPQRVEKVADRSDNKVEKPAPSAKPKAEPKAAQTQAAGPASDAKNFRWYQVKKDDRFASIAREQLGDAGRWQEVYEMNKDKFPDPQRIREGVRIKLPLAATSAKEKKR